MARAKLTFRRSDLERAVISARAVNLPIIRTEVRSDGTIVLIHAAEQVDCKSEQAAEDLGI